jgi:outer membrane protein W
MTRTTIASIAALILCATAATAADNQLSILSSNLGYGRTSSRGGVWTGGFGVAFSHRLSPRWSAEAAVAFEQHDSAFSSGPLLVTEGRSFHVFPIDLSTQYRFTSGSPWTPYFVAGVRHVSAPDRGFGFENRTSAEVGFGTNLRLTPHLGLRFDVMRLIRNDSVTYDPLTRGSIGLSWKF